MSANANAGNGACRIVGCVLKEPGPKSYMAARTGLSGSAEQPPSSNAATNTRPNWPLALSEWAQAATVLIAILAWVICLLQERQSRARPGPVAAGHCQKSGTAGCHPPH